MPYFTKPFSISEAELYRIAEEEREIFIKAAVFSLGEEIYCLRNFSIRFGHLQNAERNVSGEIEI